MFDTKQKAKKFINKFLEYKDAKPYSIKVKSTILSKPTPMNTVDMLTNAAERLGFDVSKTKDLAQKLYSKGFISYPRTECRDHAVNFQVKERLEMFERHDDY
jgi:DNA topoisomerase IA